MIKKFFQQNKLKEYLNIGAQSNLEKELENSSKIRENFPKFYSSLTSKDYLSIQKINNSIYEFKKTFPSLANQQSNNIQKIQSQMEPQGNVLNLYY